MRLRTMRFLFVCHANAQRSPTAEEVCRRIAREENLGVEASSAGISRDAKRPVTREMAEEADCIFVMEDEMAATLVEDYGLNPGKIVCLDIPDIYERNDPWLVRILEDRICGYFAQEGLI
jgi:predicted protein tyrosine phosphatase